jgi:surface polysaccharide O-acyltransferase-like enzyme
VLGLGVIVLITKIRFEHRLPIILAGGYVITVLLAFLPPAWLRAHPPQWYLFGLLFTLFGWWLSRRPPVPQRTALSLIGLGLLLAAFEGLLTRLLLHAPVMQIYGGTVVIALGVFLFTLARPRLGEGTAFPMLARFTLGVYVSHILVEYTLAPLNDRLPQLSIVWHLAYVCLVYALSVFITWGFSRLPGLQWTVQKHATGMSWIPPIQTALSSGRR